MTPEEIEAKKAKRTREHLRDAAEQYVLERCPDWVAYGLGIEPGDEDLAEETRRFRHHLLHSDRNPFGFDPEPERLPDLDELHGVTDTQRLLGVLEDRDDIATVNLAWFVRQLEHAGATRKQLAGNCGVDSTVIERLCTGGYAASRDAPHCVVERLHGLWRRVCMETDVGKRLDTAARLERLRHRRPEHLQEVMGSISANIHKSVSTESDIASESGMS